MQEGGETGSGRCARRLHDGPPGPAGVGQVSGWLTGVDARAFVDRGRLGDTIRIISARRWPTPRERAEYEADA
jgi:hypothetical protein